MNDVEHLLSRPPNERLREYKYRCAQSIVFGLPVLALQYFGASLGGPEAPRVVAILQALLAGWVMYVGAAGMLSEGAVRLQRYRQVQSDFCAAVLAILLYGGSLFALIFLLARGHIAAAPRFAFDASVLVVAIWTGIQWARCLYSVRHSNPRGE